jgi:hypothetical protein
MRTEQRTSVSKQVEDGIDAIGHTRLSNARGTTSIKRGIRFRMIGMRTLVPLLWMFLRGGGRSEFGEGMRNAFAEGVFLLGEHCHLVAW